MSWQPDINNGPAYVGGAPHDCYKDAELASLRTQLQQAEQRANGTCSKHDDRCHDRATAAESQLQQAETALRRLLREATAGHAWVSSVYIEDVASAALAAPPADPPKEP